jgi:hypothetical protein
MEALTLKEKDYFDITRYACNRHPVLAHYYADENHPVKGTYLKYLSNLAVEKWLHPVVEGIKRRQNWTREELHEATERLIVAINDRFPPPKEAKKATKKEVLALAEAGMSQREIAKTTGKPRSTIRYWLSQGPTGGPKGNVGEYPKEDFAHPTGPHNGSQGAQEESF